MDCYDLEVSPAWCPGCGNFPILKALKKALAGLELEPHQVLLCSGIGQAAKIPHYLKGNVFNGLHGRSLPAATGAKLVNPDLTVIAESGDGDMYGEGGNHLTHAILRNADITVLVHNNQVYGLTKGQASPTSEEGFVTKIQVDGYRHTRFNPLTYALSLKAGFVARGFSGDTGHLSDIIQAAVRYRGFSLVDILMPCISFNKVNTFAWYKKRVYKLEDEDWAPDDRRRAYDRAGEWGERIPTGIFYSRKRLCYNELLPELQGEPLIDRSRSPQRVKEIYPDFF
ncbi:MAG: thiamine pyrophosphate-dependent enzyme [bacterium]